MVVMTTQRPFSAGLFEKLLSEAQSQAKETEAFLWSDAKPAQPLSSMFGNWSFSSAFPQVCSTHDFAQVGLAGEFVGLWTLERWHDRYVYFACCELVDRAHRLGKAVYLW